MHPQELRDVQAKTASRVAVTQLTDEQLHEAEAVFRRLAGQGQTLSFCVDYSLANYRAPERQKPLIEAIAEYVASKEHEFEQDQISRPQMGRIRWDLKRLEQHFKGKFSFHRSWIAENPILRVPHHRIRRRRGIAITFTAAKARDLMEHFEGFEGGRWVPYFALCLFAGIRPGVPDGEISKLQPDAVDLNAGTIFVSAEVSKVREPRRVTIQPNLAAWLRAYPLDKIPIVVGDFQVRRARFAKKFNLTHDVLRHYVEHRTMWSKEVSSSEDGVIHSA